MANKIFVAGALGLVIVLAWTAATMAPPVMQIYLSDLLFPCSASKFHRQSGTVKDGLGYSTYLWPSSMGIPGNYGNSKHAGPKNFTEAFKWKWTDPYGGRFRSPGAGGTVIDDQKNIYLSWNWGITKFSPDGRAAWTYYPQDHCVPLAPNPTIMNSPALWGDAIFANTEMSTVFAVSMATGKEIWSTQYAPTYSVKIKLLPGWYNNGFTQVSPEGVVIIDNHNTVYGVSAVNGTKLWEFAPDGYVWNFKADFPGDGSFVFQTWEGTAYRCRVADGTVIWKAFGQRGTWTDGNIGLGPNNIVYAVNTRWMRNEPQPKESDGFNHNTIFNGDQGQLTAYALADGKRLWQFDFDKPPNNAMAVGRLSPDAPYTVIQPIGRQDRQWEQYNIYALDAQTGKLQWVFDGPIQKGLRQASADVTPYEQTQINGCVPNPWSAPTIDPTGMVYIANQEGQIFGLKDVNGDGKVDGQEEVRSYETLRAYDGSEAPSIAPGLMTIMSCDTLYTFRYPEK